MMISLVNINGLNQHKKYETETLLENYQENIVIMGITETHQKEDRFTWDRKWKVYEQYREKRTKKEEV